MKVVAIYNSKGGVGKTAAAVNLAYAATRDGRSSLLVDLDPQGAASFYYRVRPVKRFSRKTLLKGRKRLRRGLRGTDYRGLDALPAHFSYRHLDLLFDGVRRSRKRLREALARLGGDYEHVFLDCPPNLTLVAENVLRAADLLLVPVVPTTLAVRNYRVLDAFLGRLDRRELRVGVFLSMVERRKKLHRALVEQLRESDPRVMEADVPYSVDVEMMGVHRQPVACYKPRSRAAAAYAALWREARALLDDDAPRSLEAEA